MVAPEAVNVAELPAHTAVFDAAILTVMLVPIVTLTVFVLEQPAVVPVTVYVVLEVGDTLMTDVVALVLQL